MAGLLDFIGNNAGSLLGGLFGAGASGDTKTGATQSRDPWAAAQPYMLKNLQNEADLQSYYQKTPFNQQQQQGYSNLFGDIGNFRDNVAPGLMDFANKGMTTSYQRQQGGAPGSVGYGGGGGNVQSGSGPFSMARGAQVQNPMLDLNGAQNPYVNGGIKAPEPKAQPAQVGGGLLGGGVSAGGGHGGQAPSDSPFGGIGSGEYSDKLQQKAMDTFTDYAPVSVVGAALGALIQQGMSVQQALDAVNSTADPIGALNALQGWTGVDPSYSFYSGESTGGNSGGDGSVGGYGSNSYGGAASSEGGYGGYGGSEGGYGGYGGSGGFGGFGGFGGSEGGGYGGGGGFGGFA